MRFATFTKIDEKGAVRVLTDTAGTPTTPSNDWY